MAQRLEVVRLLVRAGSDAAQQDAHGDNALHWCARTSHATLLRYFLKETDAGVAAVFAENYKREKVCMCVRASRQTMIELAGA